MFDKFKFVFVCLTLCFAVPVTASAAEPDSGGGSYFYEADHQWFYDGGVEQFTLPEGQLVNNIEYEYKGHLGIFDEEGRLLVWEGNIWGDLNGHMKWWVVVPGPVPDSDFDNGTFSYYTARFEFYNEMDELMLAGQSSGKTVFPALAEGDGIWDGVGVVTEAKGRYNPLKGRKTYETGPVVLDGGLPYGAGMLTVQ